VGRRDWLESAIGVRLSIPAISIRLLAGEVHDRPGGTAMPDITVKRIEEFDTPNDGGFCRAAQGWE
jgi:hypothetical protein